MNEPLLPPSADADTTAQLSLPGARAILERLALLYWGMLFVCAGLAAYFFGVALSALRLLFALHEPWRAWNEARVGVSKGGNLSNRRALRVGLRMILGLSFGWRWLR